MVEQIDSHVAVEQAEKAIDALYKHAIKFQKEKESEELLPGKEQNIWLVIGVKKIYPEGKLKPFRMYVSLFNLYQLRRRQSCEACSNRPSPDKGLPHNQRPSTGV